jgi:hypothetical protein
MAAHIALEESGEKYQPQKVDLANGEQRTENYLKGTSKNSSFSRTVRI